MIDKKIFIECPVAGEFVSTGFRAPIGTDLASLKAVKLWPCPACGEEHVWNGEDGYWEEERRRRPRFWGLLNIRRK